MFKLIGDEKLTPNIWTQEVASGRDLALLQYGAQAQMKQDARDMVEWLEYYHVKGIEGDPSDIPAIFTDGGYRIPTKAVEALKKLAE